MTEKLLTGTLSLNTNTKQQLSLCHVAALKGLPVHGYNVFFFTFPGPWTERFNTFIWEQSCSEPGLDGMRDVASAIFLMDRLKSSLLFTNFGCCISKGSLFRLFSLSALRL